MGLGGFVGLLPRPIRALGELVAVVEGSSGAKIGAQGCPNKPFETFWVPSKRPKNTKSDPNTLPGAPHMSPREPPKNTY